MFVIKLQSIKIETIDGISTITFLDLPAQDSYNVYCTTDVGLDLIKQLPHIFLIQARTPQEYEKWMNEFRLQLVKYLYDETFVKDFITKIKNTINSFIQID